MDTTLSRPKILIVDDEPNIRFVLERALRHEGYQLETAANGQEAIARLSAAAPPYDLLLLDLKMDPVDGGEVLKFARAQDPDVVVIILTAHASLESAVEALRLGAFDYLFKPVTPETVRRRVREGIERRQQSVRRRQILSQIESLRQTLNALANADSSLSPPPVQSRFVRNGDLVIDRHHRQATLGDRLLELTSAEFDILLALVMAAPQPVSPRDLAHRALGYECGEQEARDLMKWHIHHLRRKVEPQPSRPRYIKTVRHRGYMWAGAS